MIKFKDLTKAQREGYKPIYKVGDQVTVTSTINKDYPLNIGDKGIVIEIDEHDTLYGVKLESGAILSVDFLEVLPLTMYNIELDNYDIETMQHLLEKYMREEPHTAFYWDSCQRLENKLQNQTK